MKVFLLEDDPVYRHIIGSDLKEMGHKVVIFGQVNGAVEKIANGKFDLLIINIILPEDESRPSVDIFDGGLAVLESLKKKGKEIPPVIFVSVVEYETNRERIEKLGLPKLLIKEQVGARAKEINTYFQRPYYTEEFLKTINKIQRILNVAYVRQKLTSLRDVAKKNLAGKSRMK